MTSVNKTGNTRLAAAPAVGKAPIPTRGPYPRSTGGKVEPVEIVAKAGFSPGYFRQNRRVAVMGQLLPIGGSGGVGGRRIGIVQHDAGNGQAVAEGGGREQRLQSVVDGAEPIGGDDDQRITQVASQVGHVLIVGHRAHQAAGAFGENDVGIGLPKPDAVAQEIGVELFAFGPGGQVRSQRGLEALGTDPVERTGASGGFPERHRVVGHEPAILKTATTGGRFVYTHSMARFPQRAGDHRGYVRLAHARVGAGDKESGDPVGRHFVTSFVEVDLRRVRSAHQLWAERCQLWAERTSCGRSGTSCGRSGTSCGRSGTSCGRSPDPPTRPSMAPICTSHTSLSKRRGGRETTPQHGVFLYSNCKR